MNLLNGLRNTFLYYLLFMPLIFFYFIIVLIKDVYAINPTVNDKKRNLGKEGAHSIPSMVKDIWPGSSSSSPSYHLVNINGTVYFSAEDGVNGRELWKSDGTMVGTIMVKDINSGSAGSAQSDLKGINGTLYFGADDGIHGKEFWKSDGTEEGTVLIKDIWTGNGASNPGQYTDMNGTIYFYADDSTHGRELWMSDGTTAGTVMVKDIWTGSHPSYPQSFVNINGTLYFEATDSTHGAELWKSDGTEAGTVLVKDIFPGNESGSPLFLTIVNTTLYFTVIDGVHGRELWRSDGTESGTVMVEDIRPGGAGSSPYYLTDANGTLYFTAIDDVHGEELWRSDGTESGTVIVKDICPGTNSSYPRTLTNVNGCLYFRAEDGMHGGELWKSDGTESGTIMVKDIISGTISSYPDQFAYLNGMLYFNAIDDVHGRELWRSDGTESGTLFVKDIFPGNGFASPWYLTVVNNMFYFTATDSIHGRELWKYEISDITDSMNVLIPDTDIVGSQAFPGDTIAIPVSIDQIEYNHSNGIYSFQMELIYNDSLFQCIGYDSSGTVLSNRGGLTEFTVKFRKDSGRGVSLDTLRIAGASDDSLYYPEVPGTPFAFPRPLIKLKFRIPTTAHNGDSTVLHFTRFMFNEGIPRAATDDGSIKLRLRKKGDVDKNGVIQPIDAILVLRNVIHDTTLDAESQIAAEVSGNGEITAYDASLILQYFVGRITTFPAGSYYKQALPSNKGADIVMEWGEVKDGMINLLVKAKNLSEVYGYSLALSYDPGVLTYQGYQSNDLTKRMTAVVRNEGGQVRLAVAGVDPLDGDGEIVSFKFKLNSNGDFNRDKLVNLNELVLNEEIIISNTGTLALPKTYSLEQNYPNPFNPETRIRYQILEARNVQLIVYNLLGQPVRTLVNEMKPAGVYEVRWDGKNDQGINLASGVYIYRIKAGNFVSTKKLILMK